MCIVPEGAYIEGENPQLDKETMGSVFIKRESVPEKGIWSARITDVQDDNMMFEVSTPVTLPVGSWSVRVVTRRRGTNLREVYDFESDLYILFNPWNPDDQTYMEETELLQEYVLNDVGKVWVGPARSSRGRAWLFAQFDEAALPACMFALDRAGVPFQHRGDPVKVSRAISRIVNSNDDQGILIGRWDGQYEDGTAPTEWTNSVDILRQFLETQQEVPYGQCWVFAGVVLIGRWDGQYEDGTAPTEWTNSVDILRQFLETQQEVPYGQCWVFAGVVVTICRALGIPCRAVTNIVSAHDANSSLSVDKYYTENMDDLDFDPNNPEGVDSIWNYHVWNDVWMARPDLPAGFGGWQSIDATPQEKSSGLYQCGPAPLEAVKQGVLGLSYDVGFMVATVNADLMRWRRDPESETGWSIVDTKNYYIGKMILTKKPYVFDPNGDEDREDITHQYKHTEGSASERLALMNGVRQSERAKRYYAVLNNTSSDVQFSLRDIDTVFIGDEFRICVDITNTSEEGRNIKAVLSATSIFYNGVKSQVVKKAEGKIFVGPGKREEISIQVTPEEYLTRLVEYGNLKITAMAIVDETKQSWADDDDFAVLKPIISVKFADDLLANQPATVALSFMNPLDVPLTGCEFRVTSSGISGRTLALPIEDVGAKELVTGQIPVMPLKPGLINFVVTFKSKELKDISGAASAEVFD
ncbi:unnamed protein product [Plutella xylostella]|uniref:(diamondback moth) hypothetical protein n=1 Tax=Plutella xylostella TaxID=51655 RepID=A0A8S4FFX2_PLUXY|nr:unnamed protein product [Plutella xylostella]